MYITICQKILFSPILFAFLVGLFVMSGAVEDASLEADVIQWNSPETIRATAMSA